MKHIETLSQHMRWHQRAVFKIAACVSVKSCSQKSFSGANLSPLSFAQDFDAQFLCFDRNTSNRWLWTVISELDASERSWNWVEMPTERSAVPTDFVFKHHCYTILWQTTILALKLLAVAWFSKGLAGMPVWWVGCRFILRILSTHNTLEWRERIRDG